VCADGCRMRRVACAALAADARGLRRLRWRRQLSSDGSPVRSPHGCAPHAPRTRFARHWARAAVAVVAAERCCRARPFARRPPYSRSRLVARARLRMRSRPRRHTPRGLKARMRCVLRLGRRWCRWWCTGVAPTAYARVSSAACAHRRRFATACGRQHASVRGARKGSRLRVARTKPIGCAGSRMAAHVAWRRRQATRRWSGCRSARFGASAWRSKAQLTRIEKLVRAVGVARVTTNALSLSPLASQPAKQRRAEKAGSCLPPNSC
jgi:hypothetical protein